jgi:hypothetical protein
MSLRRVIEQNRFLDSSVRVAGIRRILRRKVQPYGASEVRPKQVRGSVLFWRSELQAVASYFSRCAGARV